MPETMPAPNFERDRKNQDIGSDEKTLRRINELEDKWRKLKNKIESTDDEEEKRILKFEKEDLEKIIRQQYKYYDKVRDNKGLNNLREKVGGENVTEVFDFQEEKRKREKTKEIDTETEESINEDFFADYKKFRKKRSI